MCFKKMAETIHQNKPLIILYLDGGIFSPKDKQFTSYEAMKVRVAITCQNIDKKINNELRHFVGLSSHVIL